MYLIPIYDKTLDLVEALNNGVRPPRTQREQTFFLYHKDKPSEIITMKEALEIHRSCDSFTIGTPK